MREPVIFHTQFPLIGRFVGGSIRALREWRCGIEVKTDRIKLVTEVPEIRAKR